MQETNFDIWIPILPYIWYIPYGDQNKLLINIEIKTNKDILNVNNLTNYLSTAKSKLLNTCTHTVSLDNIQYA